MVACNVAYFFRHSYTPMVQPHIKVSVHISKHFMVIVKNVIISLKHEYRRLNVMLGCDVITNVISVKNTFSGIICNDLFISDVKMNLS